MPESLEIGHLPDDHAKFRAAHYDALEESEFVELVCNQGLVLPEHKVGNSFHMPCCWLGAPIARALTPELRAKQQQEYLGWRPIKYMLILPSPHGQDIHNVLAMHPRSQGGALLREELDHVGISLHECVATHVCRFDLPRTVNKYTQRHKKDGLAYLHADIANCKPDVIITFGADALKSLFGKNAKLDTYQGNVLDYECEGQKIKVVPTYSHLAFLGGHAEISVFRSELRKAKEIGDGVYSRRAVERDYRLCKTADQVVELCKEIEAANPPWIAFDTEFGNQVAREEHTETISIQLAWGPGKSAFIQLCDHEEVFKPPPAIEEYVPEPPIPWEAFCEKKYKDPWGWFAKHPEAEEKTRAEWAKKNARKNEVMARSYQKRYAAAEKAVPWRKHFEYHYERDGKFYRADKPIHSPEDWHRIWYTVQQLLLDPRWRICAHHLRVDCDQFERNGYPITDKIENGIDTMLIHHLLYGDESQGLDHLVRKYLPHYGAFWMELEEWLEATGSRKKHLQFGYRDIPFDILVPYAQCDADVTWQLAVSLLQELAKEPKLKQFYFKHIAPTSWHLYQVEQPGILVDEDARASMHDFYKPVYDELLKRVREEVNWPGFNPGSDDQLKTLLFHGAVYKDPKEPLEGAKTLGLKPLFNTDKYPREWEQIEAEGEQELNTPSVKAAALDLLYSKHPELPVLRWLKHLSVIGKFLSTYLAPQVANEYGVPEDGKGFHNNILADGRVRTHLSQLTATGRYTSSKANLQTKPKKQEAAAFEALVDFHFGIKMDEYEKRTFDGKKNDDGTWAKEPYAGPDRIEPEDRIKVPKFATCFVARPGYCLIEADFATAEMCIWAYVSGDPDLIQVVQKGRDLHSEVCANAFKLPELAELPAAIEAVNNGDKATYDKWADGIKAKYGALRIAAKSVNFGVMYGRGAAALAREINKVVTDPVTAADTQQIIDGLADAFPIAWQWLVDNSEKAVEQEYIENCFGRRRYFQGASQMSEWDQAAVKREAKNSPIQGAVADLLAQAGFMFHRIMRKLRAQGNAPDIEILLPVHDAFLYEVKIEDVPKVLPLIELCLSRRNIIPGTDHYLGVDIEIMPRSWGDKAYDPHKKGQLEAFMEEYATAA